MIVGGVMALLMSARQEALPALWFNLRGEILVAGEPMNPTFTPGATRFRGQNGATYNFTGQRGGILFGDHPDLKLTGSITVSTWLYPRSYVNDGPGAQILFRGDDRNGLDPYYFVIESDGTINFAVNDDKGRGMKVKAELPLNKWTHITANFNNKTGELNMWLDGEQVAYARTSVRPFKNLDTGTAPGFGIGNVQNNRGPHNQPFNGMLADLRLYDQVLTPEQAGYDAKLRTHQVVTPK